MSGTASQSSPPEHGSHTTGDDKEPSLGGNAMDSVTQSPQLETAAASQIAEEAEIGNLTNSDSQSLYTFIDSIGKDDTLRRIDIPLPQLVVVGNTSSGKSSLLRAITMLPFPVSSEICTFFATETQIRHCNQSERPNYEITVTTHSPDEQSLLQDFPLRYTGSDQSEVNRRLKEDIEKAFRIMERRARDQAPDMAETSAEKKAVRASSEARPRLLQDIMTISVATLDQAHISIVDIPGLVSNGTKSDVQLSEDLARRYIRNPRAITLAVLSAIDAINNQKILRLVEEADATDRTIGVLTKSDLVQAKDEKSILELLKNEHSSALLPMGWFAVRNLSTAEVDEKVSFAERNRREVESFNQAWQASIDRNRVGIDNLRSSLAGALHSKIKSCFPEVRHDLEKMKAQLGAELIQLGAPHDTPQSQRACLVEMQHQYYELAKGWREGDYKEDCVNADDPSRLRYNVEVLHTDFNDNVRQNGLRYAFEPLPQLSTTNEEKPIGVHMDAAWQEEVSKASGTYAWILARWKTLRGSEPSLESPRRLKEHLFREQTDQWGFFARSYLEQVVQKIEACNVVLFHTSCPDARVKRRIRDRLRAAEVAALDRADQELHAIVCDNRRHLKTQDPAFAMSQPLARTTRHTALLEYAAKIEVRQEAAILMLDHGADASGRIYDTHDWLKAYTEIAMSRFIDNIIIQVVERHLLGPKGPLEVFSLEWVISLSDDELEELLEEEEGTKLKRLALQGKLDALDAAIRKADQLARW